MANKKEKNECSDDITVESLIAAQKSIEQKKWKLKSILLPKDCKIEETEDYKSIEIEYTPVSHEKIKTEILQNDKKYFPYQQFNTIQSLVFDSIYNTRENVLVAAPTGTGKTELAILAILKEFFAYKEKSFIVYLAPTKSLIKQTESTLKKRLNDILKIEQDTTDTHRNNHKLWEYKMNVLVTTPERYDILTLKKRIAPTLLIIDEIHILGETRGGVLESVIIRSKGIKNIRMLGISATIPNYRDVAAFINAKNEHSYYFSYSCKEIPMVYKILGVKKSEKSVDILNKHLQHAPTLIFINSRKECHRIAHLLRCSSGNPEKMGDQPQKNIHSSISQDDKLNSILPHLSSIIPALTEDRNEFIRDIKSEIEMLYQGIGVHHSGMSKNVRSAVETLFREGAIRAICCTSTLACGVNLPADNVIIYKTKTNHLDSDSNYSLSEISQMSGRAGRKGLSSKGSVTIITDMDKIEEYSRAITFQFPIESKLAHTLPTRILYEINAGKNTAEKLAEWIKETYAYSRGIKHKETEKYFLDVEQLLNSILSGLVQIEAIALEKTTKKKNKDGLVHDPSLDTLSPAAEEREEDIQIIRTKKRKINDLSLHPRSEEDKEKPSFPTDCHLIKPTLLGSAAFKYYLDPKTVYRMNRIFREIKNKELDLDGGDMLLIVSTAEDYKSIVNTHSEERNADYANALSKLKSTLKYPIRSKDGNIRKIIENESETKEVVSVLVQAHIDRAEIDRSLYSIYTNTITSIERIIWACFTVGRVFLNRSIHSLLDLAKSIEEREWRYMKKRGQLDVKIEIDKNTIRVANPQKCEIFFTLSAATEYTNIHTEVTKKEVYYYTIPKNSTRTPYKLQIDTMHTFTEPIVQYIEL
ncbi:activating signal cointegrator complex subunit 3 [Nematocida minor]|uniref:activating signal cointegrator complex subunit 3 n=1 Tax=Nematocida minor TaxID=1912983 RepID=UPI00221F2BFC|nr:activating signal cointegrator complex subunit 3 [Nematocida minor]KAI5189452.1 activating signal cointegrator complex subunit 3 [Nematocida minor]